MAIRSKRIRHKKCANTMILATEKLKLIVTAYRNSSAAYSILKRAQLPIKYGTHPSQRFSPTSNTNNLMHKARSNFATFATAANHAPSSRQFSTSRLAIGYNYCPSSPFPSLRTAKWNLSRVSNIPIINCLTPSSCVSLAPMGSSGHANRSPNKLPVSTQLPTVMPPTPPPGCFAAAVSAFDSFGAASIAADGQLASSAHQTSSGLSKDPIWLPKWAARANYPCANHNSLSTPPTRGFVRSERGAKPANQNGDVTSMV